MTGAVLAAATTAAGDKVSYSITVGSSGGLFGYNPFSGPMGACSPTPTENSLKGQTYLVQVYCIAPTLDLRIVLNGTSVTQSFFRSVTVQRTDGTVSTLTSSSATFSVGSGIVEWDWTGGSNVWTSTTPSPRFLIFNF